MRTMLVGTISSRSTCWPFGVRPSSVISTSAPPTDQALSDGLPYFEGGRTYSGATTVFLAR